MSDGSFKWPDAYDYRRVAPSLQHCDRLSLEELHVLAVEFAVRVEERDVLEQDGDVAAVVLRAADRTFKRPALALFAEEGRLNCPLPGLPALFASSRLPAPDLPDTTTPPESPHPLLCSPFWRKSAQARRWVAAGAEQSPLQVSHQSRLGRRRPRAERQLGLLRIRGRLLQMRQNPPNDLRPLDAGDHLELPAATGAGVDLDAEQQ